MSIAHDETTLLSNHHANFTHTYTSEDADDSSVDVTQIAVHLAELGFLEDSIQEYQVLAANWRCYFL